MMEYVLITLNAEQVCTTAHCHQIANNSISKELDKLMINPRDDTPSWWPLLLNIKQAFGIDMVKSTAVSNSLKRAIAITKQGIQ